MLVSAYNYNYCVTFTTEPKSEYITHVGSGGRKLGQPPNKTGSLTQNSVQPSQGTKRKPSQQRTAAVNTAGYKCVDV